tara:strand:+ start:2908 stop:3771 length:864 start_codon:yes stop_codon:yes gene_type:complete
MKKPFFSIIIPCFNVEKSIIPTLESLNKQDFNDLELIFINDGSTDNTINIIKNFKCPHKKIIINKSNGGLGSARNAGIKRSNGKYVCLLDADDTWLSNKLKIIFSILSKNKQIELLCHNEFVVNENGKILKKNYYGPHTSFKDLYFKGNCLSPSAVTIKNNVFNKVGYFTENLELHGVEDYDMWLRCGEKKINFYYVPDFLGNYIIHGENMSVKFEFYDKIENLLYLYSNYLPNNKYYRYKLKIKFLKFYLGKLLNSIQSSKSVNIYKSIKDIIRFIFKYERNKIKV